MISNSVGMYIMGTGLYDVDTYIHTPSISADIVKKEAKSLHTVKRRNCARTFVDPIQFNNKVNGQLSIRRTWIPYFF